MLRKGVCVLVGNLFAEVPIALLQATPDIFETVRPDAIFVPVFPIMTPRRDRRMVLADQHRFDPSRAELNAEDGLSAIDCFGDIVSIHVHLSEDLKASLQRGIAGVSSWFVKLPAAKKPWRCGDLSVEPPLISEVPIRARDHRANGCTRRQAGGWLEAFPGSNSVKTWPSF